MPISELSHGRFPSGPPDQLIAFRYVSGFVMPSGLPPGVSSGRAIRDRERVVHFIPSWGTRVPLHGGLPVAVCRQAMFPPRSAEVATIPGMPCEECLLTVSPGHCHG